MPYFSIPRSFVLCALSSLSYIFPKCIYFRVLHSQVPIVSTLCSQSYMFSGTYISSIPWYISPFKGVMFPMISLRGAVCIFSHIFNLPCSQRIFPWLVIRLWSLCPIFSWPCILTSLYFQNPIFSGNVSQLPRFRGSYVPKGLFFLGSFSPCAMYFQGPMFPRVLNSQGHIFPLDIFLGFPVPKVIFSQCPLSLGPTFQVHLFPGVYICRSNLPGLYGYFPREDIIGYADTDLGHK